LGLGQKNLIKKPRAGNKDPCLTVLLPLQSSKMHRTLQNRAWCYKALQLLLLLKSGWSTNCPTIESRHSDKPKSSKWITV